MNDHHLYRTVRSIGRSLGRMTLAGLLLGMASLPAGAQQKFNDWGWPEPDEKISAKSVTWLKEKGWWPIGVAFQGPWSGQNTLNVVMNREGLLAKRGIESKFQTFGAGPDINEAVASGRFHVGHGGNFPFTSLLDKKVPVKVLAVLTPNIKHAVVVPLNSPAKALKDFKGSNPPAVIGIVTGSSAEFFFTQAAEVHGLAIGKDVVLKNMPIADQLTMPQGVAAVVPWEPAASQVMVGLKTGREIDSIFPYNFYEGNFYVRQEMIDNVPDVVQAIMDAHVEADLWVRRHPEKAVEYLLEEPMIRGFGRELLAQQTLFYNIYYKPTAEYPFVEFWGQENERIANWLHQRNRIQTPLKAKDYAQAFDVRFIDKTYGKLGWAIPKTPPFLPAGWKGKIGKVPYPDYDNVNTLKAPQPWPAKGDLVKPWSFAGKTHQP